MALGQELGLVLPIFAHAGVIKMLLHMWKEKGWGRACSWLEGRGKKREGCLKHKIPPAQITLWMWWQRGRAEQGGSGTGAATHWPFLAWVRVGAHCELCSPLHPLCCGDNVWVSLGDPVQGKEPF